MALCPFARHLLIRPGSSDPPIDVVGAILHVDAGNNESLFTFFRDRSGGIESHFHIRRDGVIEQYRDTGFEADANFKANSFIEGGRRKGYVSIETQGFGEGEWTDAQLDSIKRLLKWLAETHNFPLEQCQHATDPGVGYHTLFGAPSAWTPVAKSCPGPDRKRQFHDLLVPWMTEGDDMFSEDDAKRLARIEKKLDVSNRNQRERDRRIAKRIATQLRASEESVLEAIAEADNEEPAPKA